MKKIKIKNFKINKKVMIICIISILVIIFSAMNLSTEIVQNVDNNTEIEPQEEIAEQKEETEVKLYYVDKTSGVITPEIRKIEAKTLIDKPYIKILEMLVEGPQSENLTTEIPKETKINSAELTKGVLKIDISDDFLNTKGTNAIYQIVDTMTELNEVEGVKLTFNGKVQENLQSEFIRK
jgi:spore germination protein GerM